MKTSDNSKFRIENIFHYIFSITIVLLLSVTGSFAQNIWQGGTPGAESDWNNPENWSKNRVPDWSDISVVIPDVSSNSGFFPEIKSQVPTIATLSVEGGAQLFVTKNGNLTIDGESTYNYGIINTGMLVNEGKLIVCNTALDPLEKPNNPIIDKGGVVAFLGSVEDTLVAKK